MHKTINEGEIGVLRCRGIIIKELGPGRHHYSPLLQDERITVIDSKVFTCTSQSQEYTTKDNLVVRFFIRSSAQVVDATKLLKTTDYSEINSLIANTTSDVARSYVAVRTLEELLNGEESLDAVVAAHAEKLLAEYGLKVITISPVSILIPRSLKAAFEAKVSAQKKAQADLEEARGRTATLRHLANAADMVEDRPVLLQLLLGQKARNVQFNFDELSRKKK